MYKIDDWVVYKYNETKTVLCLCKKEAKAIFFMDASSEIPIVEFIRDIIYKDQETRGTIVLHAAVEKEGKAIIIAGNKGTGKSSLMLQLLYDNNCNMVTGDTLFIRKCNKNNCLYVKGWPDYPHLGIGTIKQFPMIEKSYM